MRLSQSHSLNCSQSGAENIDPTITYEWSKDINGKETVVGNTSTLHFSHLNLSDAAKYTCTVTVNSSYLNEGNGIVNQSTISLKLPSKCNFIIATMITIKHHIQCQILKASR